MNALKLDITVSQNLTANPLSYTTSIGRRWKPERLHIHADVAITETITITLDSMQGANYDVVLHTYTLDAEQDWTYDFSRDLKLYAGDEIKIQCTNANGVGTIYATLKSMEVLK